MKERSNILKQKINPEKRNLNNLIEDKHTLSDTQDYSKLIDEFDNKITYAQQFTDSHLGSIILFYLNEPV